jgi:hypothetical protein
VRLIGLKAENIKRLKVIDLTPNEHINRISGGNGSGKSSVLDAIQWLLTGTSTVPSQPVRKGSGKAVIWGDLGDLIATRRFVEGGSRNGTFVLEPKNGNSRYQGPQDILDKLMGSKLSFDPLEFLRMHPKKQLEVLKTLVQVDCDVDINLKVENDPDYLRRREAKKEKLAVETRRDAVYVAPDLPKLKIDEAALVQELREASSFNSEIARKQEDRNAILRSQQEDTDILQVKVDRIAALEEEIKRLRLEVKEDGNHLARTARIIKEWEPLPKPKDAAQLAEQIDAARKINQGIDRRILRDQYQNEADALEVEIETLSAALDEREAKKTEALARAEFPVPGLAFGDEEVIYRGFPFNQISNAEQIRCSVAIGMAMNPELRIMCIKDGSLMDDKATSILTEMAKAHDYQIFMEVVDTSGKVGIYLEDGEVAAVNPEPEEAATKPTPKRRAKKEAANA